MTSEPVVRVLVIEDQGSAPRAAGAAMAVFADRIEGSIGGGALEHDAIAAARAMLSAAAWTRKTAVRALGPDLGQCCGGHVRLLLEKQGVDAAPDGAALTLRRLDTAAPPRRPQDRRDLDSAPRPVARAAAAMLSGERPAAVTLFRGLPEGEWLIEPAPTPATPLFLYGAGHVGRALVRTLAEAPFAITWVDTALDRFPPAQDPATAHARRLPAVDPSAAAALAPAGALHLVMTYSHAIDLAICRRLLLRGDFSALGLIGSASKRARFRNRLAEAGVAPAMLDRMICPIGVPGIPGKEPSVIALAVAAQALQWRAALADAARTAPLAAPEERALGGRTP